MVTKRMVKKKRKFRKRIPGLLFNYKLLDKAFNENVGLANSCVILDITKLQQFLHSIGVLIDSGKNKTTYLMVANTDLSYKVQNDNYIWHRAISFNPSFSTSDVPDLTKKRHKDVFMYITHNKGMFMYKNKSYYCQNGNLFTYPDFEPIIVSVQCRNNKFPYSKTIHKMIIISKFEGDKFIKGLVNKVAKGVDKMNRVGVKRAFKVIGIDSIVPYNAPLKKVFYFNLACQVKYSISTDGIAHPEISEPTLEFTRDFGKYVK